MGKSALFSILVICLAGGVLYGALVILIRHLFFNSDQELAKARLQKIIEVNPLEFDKFRIVRSFLNVVELQNIGTHTEFVIFHSDEKYLYPLQKKRFLPDNVIADANSNTYSEYCSVPGVDYPIYPIRLLAKGTVNISDRKFRFCKAIHKSLNGKEVAVFWAVSPDQENKTSVTIYIVCQERTREFLDQEVAAALSIIRRFQWESRKD